MRSGTSFFLQQKAPGKPNRETFKGLLRCDRTAAMEPVAEQPEVSLTEGIDNEKLFSVVCIKVDVG
jgi:hypothetical protein